MKNATGNSVTSASRVFYRSKRMLYDDRELRQLEIGAVALYCLRLDAFRELAVEYGEPQTTVDLIDQIRRQLDDGIEWELASELGRQRGASA